MRLAILLLAVFPVLAQEPAADAPKPRQQGHEPKNLKLLQPSEVRAAMGAFRVALGVECGHCHVKGDFASDENPKKDMARKMIVMTREDNKIFPEGKTRVTCFTCHRGAVEPLTGPAAAAPSN